MMPPAMSIKALMINNTEMNDRCLTFLCFTVVVFCIVFLAFIEMVLIVSQGTRKENAFNSRFFG